jgi:hypothetical protein
LWEDGLKKADRKEYIKELAGLIRIELPKEDFEEIREEVKEEIEEKVSKSRESVKEMIEEFEKKGYKKASTYLKNAFEHLFTVVEKWLEIGYMPPRVISLLERVMREIGRRIKKIGASWSERGVLAVANVIVMRIYSPEQWRRYWANLMDIKGRCFVKSFQVSFNVLS